MTHIGFHIDMYSTQGIDDFNKPLEVGYYIVIDLVLSRSDTALQAASGPLRH